MEPLILNATEQTPEVRFNLDGQLFIKGKSYHEDSVGFFQPILKWVDQYKIDPKACQENELNVEFTYFNSASAKCLYMLLSKISEVRKQGKKLNVIWYFHEDDSEMKETGEEFSELLDLPFTFKETN